MGQASVGAATSQSLAADMVQQVIKEQLLDIAEKNAVFYDIADKERLPEGSGKTVQFSRYERLAIPRRPIAEGTDPAVSRLNVSTVTAVVDQWAALVELTDVAQLTISHPVLKIARERLSLQHTELIDRECQTVLMGSNNVFFPTGVSSRSGIGTASVIDTDLLRKRIAQMRSDGAPTFQGDLYVGIFDPFVEMDMNNDTVFEQAGTYQQILPLLNAEVGKWMGVRWKRSNLLPILTAMTANWVTEAQGTSAAFVPPGTVGFTAASTVRTKVTKLNDSTGFEEVIDAEVSNTNAGIFGVQVTISGANAPSGTYNVYASMENGVTPTLQRQVEHVGGVDDVITLVKSGSPTTPGAAYIVNPTGPVAPPNTSATASVHMTYIFGRHAFGVLNLGGLQTTITPNSPDSANPLMLRRMLGWKQIFKAFIKDTTFYCRIESASAY